VTTPAAAERPIDALELNIQLQLVQDILRRFRRLFRVFVVSVVIGGIAGIAAVAVWYFVPPPLTALIGSPLAAVFLVAVVVAIASRSITPVSGGEWAFLEPGVEDKRQFLGRDYELLGQQLRADRRARGDGARGDQRLAYQDDITFYIDELRVRGVRSRRANNIVQIITIVGSLAATALGSLAIANDQFRWASPAITFVVGTASGVAAIYKFKDRSFYAQQTANSIDQELSAFNLGIGRYAAREGFTKEDARTVLVEELHRIRTEQENREQNLDQPTQKSTDSE
jgi:hypothetical protein